MWTKSTGEAECRLMAMRGRMLQCHVRTKFNRSKNVSRNKFIWWAYRYNVKIRYKCLVVIYEFLFVGQRMTYISSLIKYSPPPPQPFYGPFSGTTRVSWCQKRTSGLYGARED